MEVNKKVEQAIRRPWVKGAVMMMVVITGILVLLGVADAALYAGKVHRGVRVGGLAVGGKSQSELTATIRSLADEVEYKQVRVTYGEKAWTADARKLGVRVDAKATAAAALDIGHEGSLRDVVRTRAGLWFKPMDIQPVLEYDQDKLDSFINGISKEIDEPAEDAAIKIVEDRSVATSSKDGRGVQKHTLNDKLLKSFATKSLSSIALPVGTLYPDITEKDLVDVKETVAQMIKEPVILRYKDNEWQIPAAQIKSWVDFKKVRAANHWALEVSLEKDSVVGTLEELTKEVTIKPIDAEFKIDGDKVAIVPSSEGTKVDADKAYNNVVEASKSPDDRVVMLAMKTVEPKLTTDDAGKMGIKDKVSSYTTFFNPHQISRVHNIQTLSLALDGNIVAPDEVFSFNGTIGPRTAAKGYREAPAILNGELVPSLGGGVCQVATTLFNTVFFGGYDVIERHNHSFFISHYPAGRDATVSYDGPDFKFKNNTEYYVLIKTEATKSAVTISFYSTAQGIKVDYSATKPGNFRPAKIEYQDDPTLPKGVTKVFDKGESGRDITVYRKILKNGEVVKEDKFFSRYVPKKQIVKVGTKDDGQPIQSGNPPAGQSPATQTSRGGATVPSPVPQ